VRSAAFVACLHLLARLVGYHPTAAYQAAPRLKPGFTLSSMLHTGTEVFQSHMRFL